jgi:LuxR family maltose regulon positive regulatory protein
MSATDEHASAVVLHRLRPAQLAAHHLARPGLVQRVLQLPAAGTCLLTAPAGYGSTALLAEVAEAASARVVWVSCPRDDRSAVWAHVLAALHEAGVPTARARRLVSEQQWTSLHVELLNALAASPTPLLLLLDDVDGLVHRGVVDDLTVLVDSLPDTVRLVLRVEHEHLSPRRSTSGRIIVLGIDDLALSDEQARALLGRLAPELPPARADALLALADGCAAALTLPFLPGLRGFDQDPAGWLLDVGTEQLCAPQLDDLDPHDRELLARASVLDEVSVEGLARLADGAESQVAADLHRLQRWGLLRAAPTVGGYRLPPLLHEHLRRTVALRGPRELRLLHTRASAWAEQAGDVKAAVTHALEAGDVARSLTLLEGSVAHLLDTGGVSTVRGWYARTPDALVTEHDVHLLAAGWSDLLSGNPDGAARRLAPLLATLGADEGDPSPPEVPPAAHTDDTGPGWLAAEVTLLQAYLEWWSGRPERSIDLVDRSRLAFGDRWSRMAHQASMVTAIRGRLWLGRLSEARALLVDVSARPGTREYLRRVMLPGLHGLLAAAEGRSYRARHVAQLGLQSAREMHAVTALGDADARLALARAYVDLDEPRAAVAESAAVAALADEQRHVSYQVLARLVQAEAVAGTGDVGAALQLVADARRSLRQGDGGPELLGVVALVEIRVRTEAGERTVPPSLLRVLPRGASADLLTIRLSPRGGEHRLSRLRGYRPQTVRQMVQAQLALAATLAPTRPSEAGGHLHRAAALAVENGLLTSLRGAPEQLLVLAERVSEQGASDSVGALLQHVGTAHGPEPPPGPATGPTVSLSAGELELLDVMRTVRGQADLADVLGVSVNTVKTRLRRLYRKLGVSSRDAALAAAAARAGPEPTAEPLSPPR